MKKNKQTIAKYTRLYAIGLWGILSIIWLSGEPIDDMALGKFCLLKGIGLASLGLCCLVGKRLPKIELRITNNGHAFSFLAGISLQKTDILFRPCNSKRSL